MKGMYDERGWLQDNRNNDDDDDDFSSVEYQWNINGLNSSG